MPVSSVTTARDQMFDVLKSAMSADPVTEDVVILWEDAAADRPMDVTDPGGIVTPVPPGKAWIRAGVRHVEGGQASLGDHTGRRLWNKTGMVFVQVFAPAGGGQARTDAIAHVVLMAFRGKATAGGISFTRHRIEEVGTDGHWYQVNAMVDFEYHLIA